MEEINKQNRILLAAAQLFSTRGIEMTSVNDIVKEANVAKGTFYVYYKDKNELISLFLTEKHGTMLNDLLNTSYELAARQKRSWKHVFTQELISFYQEHPEILSMIQKHAAALFNSPNNRRRVFSHVERLDEFLQLLKREQESSHDAANRLILMMEIISVTCYNAIFYKHPDTMEHLLPELSRIIKLI